jgi:hypothetical protein
MYHEVFIYVEDRDGSTGYLIPQHLNFCKRNVRTPAWVYNVIMSAWIIVRSGTLGDHQGSSFHRGFFILRLSTRQALADFP